MKFYEFGDKNNKSIMLLPGTSCHWKNNFGHVIDLLKKNFYVICASYDGFDENESSIFKDMITEAKKIEEYIIQNLNGRIDVIYGCSLGGSFIGILMQRNKIHMDHGILGSSDLDQADQKTANRQAAVLIPILYHFMHKGKAGIFITKIFEKKFGKKAAESIFKMFFGINGQSVSFFTKESMKNQYISDLVTKLDDNIEVKGTIVHCFYAYKMGDKYLLRYKKHFKNPDIRTHNLYHEELLALRPREWVKEIEKCVKKNLNEK